MRTRKDQMEYESLPKRSKGRRMKRRYWLVGAILFLLAVVGVGVPFAASNRSWVLYGINQYGGLAPLQVDLDSISVGWFEPIRIGGLRVTDGNGDKLVSIGQISTSKGLWGFASNRQDIGVVQLKDLDVYIEVEPGTTNLERALQPMLAKPAEPGASASGPKGSLLVENCNVWLRDTIDLSTWKCTVEKADIPLPTASQPIPAANVLGFIQAGVPANAGQSALPPLESIARFSVKVLPSSDAVQVNASQGTQPPIRLQAVVQNAPLGIWGIAKRRMPELPVDRLQGLASIQADLTLLDGMNWIANIDNAQLNDLVVNAKSLVGEQPASLKQGNAKAKISLNQGRFQVENAYVQCDVGQLQGNASVALPLALPTPTRPWIEGADFALQGAVDMAQLLRAAPGVITMREQTQLTAGKASLSATQSQEPGKGPNAKYHLQLGDLQATVNGAPMEWKQALSADIEIASSAQGEPRVNAKCLAEFCKLDGEGDLRNGKLTSEIDLDKLQQRLSNWFVLPVSQMAGKAQCQLNWRQDDGERLQVTGTLLTTPVRVRLASGDLLEPAWNGKFEMIARVVQGSLTQMDRASATLTSVDESLQLDILDPISWLESPNGMQPLPAAGMSLKLVGDLASWQKRGQMFAGMDTGIGLGGRCDLLVKGAIDTKHLEVVTANWNAKPFQIKGSGFAINEPEMQGEFKGRFDSRDLTNLVVDQLTVQALSFALTARDAANPNGGGRQGMAAFRIDPTRMMSAIDTGSDPNAATTSVQGDVTGRANWTLGNGQLAWRVDVDGKNINVVSLPPRGPGILASNGAANNNTTLLWNEPEAKAMLQGSYRLEDGKLDLPVAQLQTVWLAYSGKTTIDTVNNQMKVEADGQMNYDAGRVAERLKPWIGNYVAIQGQRTEPVKVVWQGSNNGHWSSGLQAMTRLGWDSANVVGIDIGKGDVPISIEDGHMKSKTEIPISQGKLRWDLDGDVETLVIQQAPEVVLDHVAITPMMCQGWLKYVAPILAEVTEVQGQLSLKLDEARIVPSDLKQQKFRGELQLHGATVGPGPLADQLMGIVQQIRTLRKGATAATATAQNSWLQMPEQKIEFAVDSGRVIHRNMQIAAGDIVINTSGEVAVDGSIQMVAQVPIRQEWIDSTPVLASLAGQSLQLPITGTIQRPQVDFRGLGQLTTQMATNAAQGYLQKQLDKGFNKLLGPMQQQLQNIQQGLPLPQGK